MADYTKHIELLTWARDFYAKQVRQRGKIEAYGVCGRIDAARRIFCAAPRCSDTVRIEYHDAMAYLHRWIYSMLEDASGCLLSDWIEDQTGSKISYYNPHHMRKLARTRLAWCEWMINELKK